MEKQTARLLAWLCLIGFGFLAGCRDKDAAPPPSTSAPPIPVAQPVRREITDYVDFTGRTDAVESVSIRARVTGYLVRLKDPFPEGREVKAGDLLFQVDPRPYQAQYDQAVSQVAVNEASLKLAQATLARDEAASKLVAGAVSALQLDQDRAAVAEADAQLKAAKANTEAYKLNLDFTKVTSPIAGMASRYYYTPGNLVSQDSTLLTTVVSLDPIYVYFDMDETTLVKVRKGISSGQIKRYKDRSEIPVYMGLQGEDGFPHQGTFDFINNVVNPSTGSVSVRARFTNPKPETGSRLLMPGMFVRIRLPIGQPHEALLVIDKALGSDQGLKYVYVLDAEDKAQYRRVETGPLQADGLRVIEEYHRVQNGPVQQDGSRVVETGLKPDEWVVVGALQQVRPRMKIEPDRVTMPSYASSVPLAGGAVGPPASTASSPPVAAGKPATAKPAAGKSATGRPTIVAAAPGRKAPAADAPRFGTQTSAPPLTPQQKPPQIPQQQPSGTTNP